MKYIMKSFDEIIEIHKKELFPGYYLNNEYQLWYSKNDNGAWLSTNDLIKRINKFKNKPFEIREYNKNGRIIYKELISNIIFYPKWIIPYYKLPEKLFEI